MNKLQTLTCFLLPGEKVTYEYKKEYGSDILELSKASVNTGDKILVVDDLLATGGSALAACNLISKNSFSF